MGLTIPFLLTTHVVGTRLAHAWFDVQDSYAYVVLALWWYRPDIGVLQAIVLLLAWLHGCIGMHFWLRLQPWYGRVVPWLFGWPFCCQLLPCSASYRPGAKWLPRPMSQAGAKELCKRPMLRAQVARQSLNQVRTVVPVAFGAAIGAILVARAHTSALRTAS